MKRIKLTEAMRKEEIRAFEEFVNKARLDLESNNRVAKQLRFNFEPKFTLSVTKEEEESIIKPKIIMNAEAYLKMLTYVLEINIECAWLGYVSKNDNVYTIEDVEMYPHIGSGAYVESDDSRFAKWEENKSNESYIKRRFQAHSHVNMGVTPSYTDIQNQKEFMNDILDYVELNPDNLTEDINPFYIFAIMNKKQEINWFIYDFVQNIKFEKDDIDFTVQFSDGSTLEDVHKNISDNHKKKTITSTNYNYADYIECMNYGSYKPENRDVESNKIKLNLGEWYKKDQNNTEFYFEETIKAYKKSKLTAGFILDSKDKQIKFDQVCNMCDYALVNAGSYKKATAKGKEVEVFVLKNKNKYNRKEIKCFNELYKEGFCLKSIKTDVKKEKTNGLNKVR